MRRLPAILAVIVLTVTAIAFTVSNPAPARVELGAWSLTLPLFAVVLTSLLTGFVLGVLVAWQAGRARRRQAREFVRRNAALKRQIDDLRRAQTIPGAIEAGQPGRSLVVNG